MQMLDMKFMGTPASSSSASLPSWHQKAAHSLACFADAVQSTQGCLLSNAALVLWAAHRESSPAGCAQKMHCIGRLLWNCPVAVLLTGSTSMTASIWTALGDLDTHKSVLSPDSPKTCF